MSGTTDNVCDWLGGTSANVCDWLGGTSDNVSDWLGGISDDVSDWLDVPVIFIVIGLFLDQKIPNMRSAPSPGYSFTPASIR